LFSNSTGNYNTATEVTALYTNTPGNSNTAVGWEMLAALPALIRCCLHIRWLRQEIAAMLQAMVDHTDELLDRRIILVQ